MSNFANPELTNNFRQIVLASNTPTSPAIIFANDLTHGLYWDIDGLHLTGLSATPTDPTEAASKQYVDDTSGGGGGANTALSNLAAVAINASLLPGLDDDIDLGSPSLRYVNLYLSATATVGTTLNVNGSILNADGASGTPSYSFTSNPVMGFWAGDGATNIRLDVDPTHGLVLSGSGGAAVILGNNVDDFTINAFGNATLQGNNGSAAFLASASGFPTVAIDVYSLHNEMIFNDTAPGTIFKVSNVDILTLYGGGIHVPNGTAGAPGFTFITDDALGWFKAATDSISLSIAAVERIRFTAPDSSHVVLTGTSQAIKIDSTSILDLFVNGISSAEFDIPGAGDTGLLLNVEGTPLQRVKVGAAGSGPGGSGRALYVS